MERTVTGMAEYIEKDKLRLMKTEECAGHTIEYAMGWKACVEWVKSLPAADVRENVKAEWVPADEKPYIRKHFHTMACSNCRKRKDGKWNFCPNCGAKMEVQDG